jgi:hypothetical protein
VVNNLPPLTHHGAFDKHNLQVLDLTVDTKISASFDFYPPNQAPTKEISVLSTVFFYREASKAISSGGKGEEKVS